MNTDYKYNPRHGNDVAFFISAGNKVVKKNNTITQLQSDTFNYASLYDTVKLNSYQFKIKFNAAQYFNLRKYAVLKLATQVGWFQSPNYFTNELFQIGGTNTLRGFDEASIYASRFGIATIEYRYLIGLNSFFFGFTDLGLTYNSVSSTDNNFIGFGLGMAFETKQGILNISLAEGKRNDLPFNFRQSKIHIGFVSLF